MANRCLSATLTIGALLTTTGAPCLMAQNDGADNRLIVATDAYRWQGDTIFQDEFKAWAFEHEPGDKGIVKTVFGYHVMELLEIRTGIEEMSSEAENALKNQKIIDMVEDWKSQPQFKLVKNDKVYNGMS